MVSESCVIQGALWQRMVVNLIHLSSTRMDSFVQYEINVQEIDEWDNVEWIGMI